jgi:ankyrin repeat protein
MNFKSVSLALIVLAASQSGLAMEKELPDAAKELPTIEDAIDAGNVQAVKDFIKAGGNVNQKNCFQVSLLHRTVSLKNENMEIVKELVSNGADIDPVDLWLGQTPLHWAASHGCIDLVRILIENGADINCKDRYGETPLMKAKESFACCGDFKYQAVIQLLLEEIERQKEIR